MPLSWHEASNADRSHLQVFVCTYPDKCGRDPVTKKKTHPQPWQMRVQTGLRGLRPPLTLERLFVGYDEDGLAAVGMYELRATEAAFYIRAVARAQRRAHAHLADEVLAQLIDRITVEPAYLAGFRDVFCEIHWKNHASKKLFKRFGFECVGHDGDLETWVIDLGAVLDGAGD